MLGADTRSTAGTTVADKNCEKIHYIAPNIYCCGAGTAADTENVTGAPRLCLRRACVMRRPLAAPKKHLQVPIQLAKHNTQNTQPTNTPQQNTAMISSALELHRYATGRQARVVTAMTMLKSHLFRYQGHVSAALVLGGVDLNGPHLFTVRVCLCFAYSVLFSVANPTHHPQQTRPPKNNHPPPPPQKTTTKKVFPHGSTDALPYATMGSGSLNAMAVFEAGYKDDMSRDEAVALVAAAIRSGIYNDLGSGSNVDVCVITRDGVDYKRNYEYLQGKTYARKFPVVYAPGTAPVLKEKVVLSAAVAIVEGAPEDGASMDTS